jgi:hypothetical protein
MKKIHTAATAPAAVRRRLEPLLRRRQELERSLRQPRPGMIAACLVERRVLAGGKRRQTPAYYLSAKADGKTVLTYVRAEHLQAVRKATDRWRSFAADLARWVKLSAQIERLWRDLGKAQRQAFPPDPPRGNPTARQRAPGPSSSTAQRQRR